MTDDVVARWNVNLSDGVHKVEFEHGTTTGKRVIRVNGNDIFRKEWMFKLVGREYFEIGKAKCIISIDAVSGFAYEYTLEVNGKPLEKFSENQSKIMKSWIITLADNQFRVVLEKDTLDIWVNGDKIEAVGEFVDDGTETHFEIGAHSAYIKAVSSGHRKKGLVHKLFLDDKEMPEAKE